MDAVRKHHNALKRALIQCATPPGAAVLDVGCGAGGDISKWKNIKSLDMCDPGTLDEAKRRAQTSPVKIAFYQGDILSCPLRLYDVICYNFSIQYIFASKKLFFDTIQAITQRLTKGGVLIGIVPDSDMILMNTPYKDSLGNYLSRGPTTGHGDFGEKVFVHLADTLYYKDGPIAEPIAYKDLLITHLMNSGFELTLWEPCQGPNQITSLYSQFIFTRK